MAIKKTNNEVNKASKLTLCISFWIFGICNNYPYVVMLSAANDILKKLEGNSSVSAMPNSSNYHIDLECTKVGSGAILIADIVPTLIFKLVAPTFIQSIKFPHKVLFVTSSAVVSFIIVGFSKSFSLTIFGVVLASLSSGVGEVTFLALTAFYDKDSLLFWSSGTGGAGVFGALSYAGLTLLMSSRNALFSVSFVPLLITIFYIAVLQKPKSDSFHWYYSCKYKSLPSDDNDFQDKDSQHIAVFSEQKAPKMYEKLHLIKGFLFLTIPLALVYLFEYVINQALFELLYFPDALLHHPEQYRWYQVIYQVGVFISRSSIKFIKIRKTWILSMLQGVNVILLTVQIAFRFIPSYWIVFVVILYEGLLGGAAYVNTFYFILIKSRPEYKEFNMVAASFWDSLGISIAGGLSIPIHTILCKKFSN